MTGAPPLVVIAGATATGKTALAIELGRVDLAAGASPAETTRRTRARCSAGLDIGTAKATARGTGARPRITASTWSNRTSRSASPTS